MYFLQLFSLVPSFFFSFSFSVLFCHTASSPIPFPPTGTSFLSCMGSDSPPSPTSTQPDVWSSTDPVKVMLLPPFLSDQAQHVSVRGPFRLFCQATGTLENPCINQHFLRERFSYVAMYCVCFTFLVFESARQAVSGCMVHVPLPNAWRCGCCAVHGRLCFSSPP